MRSRRPSPGLGPRGYRPRKRHCDVAKVVARATTPTLRCYSSCERRLHDRGDFPLGGELTAENRGKHSPARQLSPRNRAYRTEFHHQGEFPPPARQTLPDPGRPAGHISATRPTEWSRPRPATTNDTPTSDKRQALSTEPDGQTRPNVLATETALLRLAFGWGGRCCGVLRRV